MKVLELLSIKREYARHNLTDSYKAVNGGREMYI